MQQNPVEIKKVPANMLDEESENEGGMIEDDQLCDDELEGDELASEVTEKRDVMHHQ